MKIYFTTSLSGKDKYATNYQAIVENLKLLGHDVIADHIIKTTPQELMSQKPSETELFYKKMQHWIKISDLIVAEVSFPSINVGHEATLALDINKPVIALHLPGKEPRLLEGLVSEKLRITPYTLEDLKQTLKEALEIAKDQMDVRFNFFISPKIGAYLDWISRNKKTPRAVYLRKLIEEDMAGSGYVEKGKKKTE